MKQWMPVVNYRTHTLAINLLPFVKSHVNSLSTCVSTPPQDVCYPLYKRYVKCKVRLFSPPYRLLMYVVVAVLASLASCIYGTSSHWTASMSTCWPVHPLQNLPIQPPASTGWVWTKILSNPFQFCTLSVLFIKNAQCFCVFYIKLKLNSTGMIYISWSFYLYIYGVTHLMWACFSPCS